MIFLKKIISAAVLLISAGLTLTGCSLKKTQNTNTPTPDTSTVTSTEAVPEMTESIPVTTEFTIPDIEPAEGNYVYDKAGVLDADAISVCNNYSELLFEKYLINAAIVTVSDLGGTSPYSYAEKAYEDIYKGQGSGLLLLINNDTNNDILYKTGSCEKYIDETSEKQAFFDATKDIISGDYKTAAMRLMKLGEKCPQHIFDNAGLLSPEQLQEFEKMLSGADKDISIICTTNSTEKTNEDILKEYYERHCHDGKGYMLLLDTASNKVIAYSKEQLPDKLNSALENASQSAASGSYPAAVKTAIEGIM